MATQRACDHCGAEYVAMRTTSRYCSADCRTRASMKRKSGTATAKVVHLSTAATSPVDGVESRTRQELGEKGVATALGQACLALARRIDSQVDGGSALASMVGRLQQSLEVAKAAVAVEQVEADESNPITFLQQRAAERIGRVGAAG